MLSIAISTFFAVAFFGSAAVIGMMFFQYRDKIVAVLHNELKVDQSETVYLSAKYRHRIVKAPQLMSQNRSLQPVPLRVAA